MTKAQTEYDENTKKKHTETHKQNVLSIEFSSDLPFISSFLPKNSSRFFVSSDLCTDIFDTKKIRWSSTTAKELSDIFGNNATE